ncbi:MAG: NFACT RNA binding domain-containing protein, partial [Ignavibacteriaceae bacterium]
LINQKIQSIFTQEKDKLVIEFGDDEIKFLEICVNPGESYINIRENYSRAKRNTITLFAEFENKNIDSFEIASDDRIIRLKIGNNFLFFTIRGKFTNVIALFPNEKIEAFKKLDDSVLEEMKMEFSQKTFTNIFNIPDLELDNKSDYFETIRKKYPVISKEIILEAKRRISVSNNTESEALLNTLQDIKHFKSAVFIDDHSGKIRLGVDTFQIFEYDKKETFDSLISAQSHFLTKKNFLEDKYKKLKLIHKKIENDKKRISNKINNLQAVIERGSKEDEYAKFGNLLLININKIKPGTKKISLDDTYNPGNELVIKLNPKLSAKKNTDYYFDKARSEKINFSTSQDLLKKEKENLTRINSIEEKVNSIDNIKELNTIMKELKIKDQSNKPDKEDIKIKFKHYIIEEKYDVYVGKDSKNNDLLTTKFAKQNDYWFHARSVSGSHVV